MAGLRARVVGRTFAHLSHMRQLAVRYERRVDMYDTLRTLGCARLAFNHLVRFS